MEVFCEVWSRRRQAVLCTCINAKSTFSSSSTTLRLPGCHRRIPPVNHVDATQNKAGSGSFSSRHRTARQLAACVTPYNALHASSKCRWNPGQTGGQMGERRSGLHDISRYSTRVETRGRYCADSLMRSPKPPAGLRFVSFHGACGLDSPLADREDKRLGRTLCGACFFLPVVALASCLSDSLSFSYPPNTELSERLQVRR
jgi:hypothetical protein